MCFNNGIKPGQGGLQGAGAVANSDVLPIEFYESDPPRP